MAPVAAHDLYASRHLVKNHVFVSQAAALAAACLTFCHRAMIAMIGTLHYFCWERLLYNSLLLRRWGCCYAGLKPSNGGQEISFSLMILSL